MYWLLISFICLHLFSYFTIFRNFRVFQRENVIFLFHLVFFVTIFTMFFSAWWMKTYEMTTLLGLLSLDLIYHMTFLGAWSLIQGSYSMQILLIVAAHQAITENDIILKTQIIGVEKKQNRLQKLISMGFVNKVDPNNVKLSRLGKMTQIFFRAVKSLAYIKNAG